ncbi:uncharacterized protein LOC132750501 isoform X2 [Ruditapes philippinarum]|nr:uncharacterized protein LOC132750501 isoform X2 [Ruditapes philippinarum]
MEVVLALPPTSVKCETAFSAMKLLKTKRRGRLGNRRLNDLMAIKIMSPSIEEFDPEPAIADWLMSTPSGQKRRIGERTVKTSTSSTVTISSDSEDEVMEEASVSGIQTTLNIPARLSKKDLECCDDSDSDSDDEDTDMTEDLVFSMLNTYLRE